MTLPALTRAAPLAVALPFLFPLTASPLPGLWQLLVSWACIAGLVTLAWLRPAPPQAWARQLAWGLLLAATVSSVIGLLQYFGLGEHLVPWAHAAEAGQAQGNLRQRNQQASLLSLGCWAALWLWSVRPAAGDPGSGTKVAFVAALVLLALGCAATASRTGALQWVLMGALLLWWRAAHGQALRWGLMAAWAYGLAAVMLPWLLRWTQGVASLGVFERMIQEPSGCESRAVLWANVLALIAQRPWTGWGWGELDYAHYVVLFDGPRFCALLDNAHNLPLQLAVELGLPLALLLCGGAGLLIWRARPWRETVPARQLAWGVLALVGLHSLLEYPLWYGPFQLVTLLALALLAPEPLGRLRLRVPGSVLAGMLGMALMLGGLLAWDYHRVRQLYLAPEARDPSARVPDLAAGGYSGFYVDEVNFAALTTTPLTPDSAQRVHALALALLHYSPEPAVIEALIESACLLGRRDEAAFHGLRYRAAYAREHDRWRQRQLHCAGVIAQSPGATPENRQSRPDRPETP